MHSQFAATTTTVCVIVWDKLDPYNNAKGGAPSPFIVGPIFLKVYPVVEIGRGAVAGKKELGLAGVVDEKTWRKWTKIFVEAISYLESEVVRPFVF